MQKLSPTDLQSPDLVASNLTRLKELFPEMITEGASGASVNLDVLKQLVGDKTVTDSEEKYGLNWFGKRQARQIALSPSNGTLRPCPEDSVEWDTTQNLMIEGDNLEVLKLLQKSYSGKVKLIYIDPPYNTGNDFVYKDDFRDNIKNYHEKISQAPSSNPETSGRFHTEWLNMMYPRLKLAKNLLRQDGVIFISIDDNEVANLRKVCDDIFGEENFVSTIVWEKRYSPQNAVQWFSESHDFILVYAVNKEAWQPNLLGRSEEMNARYRNLDNDPRGDWKPENSTAQAGHGTASQFYELIAPNGRTFQPPNGRCWVYTKERFDAMIADNRVWFGSAGTSAPSIKRFITEVKQGVACQTIWKYEEVGHNQEGKKEIKSLFPESVPFDTPKPTRLLERILQISTSPEAGDLVLDFFGGSGTTAHAVYSSNASDGGGRRCISVQLPEPTGQNEYCTIADITKERLRRAGAKIKAELAEKAKAQEGDMFAEGAKAAPDLGFRVFKLDSSNLKAWDGATGLADLENSVEHIKGDRSEADILYEILLKLGLDLCVPMEKRQIAGKEVWAIGGGVLLACLSSQIRRDEVEALGDGIAAWRAELAPAGDSTVIFRDSAFISQQLVSASGNRADDVAKTNLTAILEQRGIAQVRSL